jgi:hypothetical protein
VQTLWALSTLCAEEIHMATAMEAKDGVRDDLKTIFRKSLVGMAIMFLAKGRLSSCYMWGILGRRPRLLVRQIRGRLTKVHAYLYVG